MSPKVIDRYFWLFIICSVSATLFLVGMSIYSDFEDIRCRYEIASRGLVYTSSQAPDIRGCVVTFIDAGTEQERRIGGDFLVTKICPGDANY